MKTEPRRRRRRVPLASRLAIAAAGVITLAVLVIDVRHPVAPPAPEPTTLRVSVSSCAPGWTGTTSGRHQFTVENTTNELFEVQLLGADRASVYAEVETLAPGTDVPLDVALDPGTYYWRCTTGAGSPDLSPAGVVRGPPVGGVQAFLPVTYAQLASATGSYRYGIAVGLGHLASDTDALTAAVGSGDRPTSERLWLVAHLDYARLGAAYGTFGDFDTEINGRPNGLPQGVDDPSFRGFLRLEYGLWSGQTMSALTGVADQLDGSVHRLLQVFPSQATPPTDVPLRTHEILENTLQFELTGETDQGSHTNLATAAANVAGTQAALGPIAPLLEERDPTLLTTVQSGLASLATQLDGYQQPGGGWLPLQSLSTVQREQLDGTVEQLLEQLAQIPELLELSPNAADQT
jgi:high-affinity iron transporter